MAKQRKYAFTWDIIGGNYDSSRPSLGASTRIEVYRLLQYTIRDVLEQRYGTEASDDIMREAGVIAGKAFYDKFCSGAEDLNSLVKIIQDSFKNLGIGIFRIERLDKENMNFTITIDEDLDCSGLPDTDDQICVYDEGMLQGIFEAFSGKDFYVREVDCWCTGARTCRFNAEATQGK